jgi:hypothetical protein
MATAAVTYTFTNGTNADALQVNQNFTDILSFINASVVQTDGSTSLANDAVTTAKILNGAVTSAKIADATIVAGDIANNTITANKISQEDWSSWTPTVTYNGVTLTNGTTTAKYIRYGDVVLAYFTVSALNNTTNNASGAVTISLPVAAKAATTAGSGRVITIYFLSSTIWNDTHSVRWSVSGSTATANRTDVFEQYGYNTSGSFYVGPSNPLQTFSGGMTSYSFSGSTPSGVSGFLVYEAA